MREKCGISTKTKARKFGSHILETNAKNSMEIIHQNGRKVAKWKQWFETFLLSNVEVIFPSTSILSTLLPRTFFAINSEKRTLKECLLAEIIFLCEEIILADSA